MTNGKKQQYDFEKKLLEEIKHDGCYFGDLNTNIQTGMFFDIEYDKIKEGKIIKRRIIKIGDYTLKFKKLDDKSVWGDAGFIKDIQALDEYCFANGDIIEIRMKIVREIVYMHIKYVGRYV